MSRPFNLDRTVRLLIGVAITILAIWLLGVLKNVLLPFFLACLISYIMDPFVDANRINMGLKKRNTAVLVTLIDGLVVAFLLVYFIFPPVISELGDMGRMLKIYETKSHQLPMLPENISLFVESKLNLKYLIDEFENGKLDEWLDKGENIISASIEYLLHSLEWLLTFIYVIFILLDYNRLGSGFSLLIPEKYRTSASRIMNDVKFYMNKYFRSQLLISFCAAIFYCIGFSLVGLPMAIVMGMLVGILYMIPYFQYITLIPVILICLITSLDGQIDFWVLLGKCGLVYVVSQCICDYILTPKIMGKSMGLNPAIILLSLSIWGTLLGILGMIIALPLTTLLLLYYKKIFIDHLPISSPTASSVSLIPENKDKGSD